MNKITMEYIKSRIAKTDFHKIPNSTVTICNITLDNGFSVRGESACVDPKEYDYDLGCDIAETRAVNALWPLFGFMLAENNYTENTAKLVRD